MKAEGHARDAAWATGCIVVAVLAYLIGSAAGHSAALDASVAAQLLKQRAHGDAAYQRTLAQLGANNARLAKLDKYEQRAAALRTQVSRQVTELSSVNSQVADKRGELESLSSSVQRIRRRPIDLPAGHFTVGADIRPGRYAVVGSSNFVVRGSDEDVRVNTILGGGDVGVEQYVCTIQDGDTIEAEGADRFYPIE